MLTGAQIGRLTNAVLDTFNKPDLELVIHICMDVVFADYVSQADAFKHQVYAYIVWTNRVGRVMEFVRCLHEQRKNCEAFKTILLELTNEENHVSTSIFAKLEQLTGEALREGVSEPVIPYQERSVDQIIRTGLEEIGTSKLGNRGWIVIGNAGIGKTTLLMRTAKWCKESDLFFPVWLDINLFFNNGIKINEILQSEPKNWGERLQQLSLLSGKRIVTFVDSLDTIALQSVDVTSLVQQMNELAFNSVLICSCRIQELKYIEKNGKLNVECIELSHLSYQQVIHVLQASKHQHHIELRELSSSLIEMCQEPLNLYLLLESSRAEPLPHVSHPTQTWLRRVFWDRRITRQWTDAPVNSHRASVFREQLGQERARLVYGIATQLLQFQSYTLSQKQIESLLGEESEGESIDSQVLNATYLDMLSEGIIRVNERVGFWHNSFADFVICKYILMATNWTEKVSDLLGKIANPFFVPIVVNLVLQARDEGKSDAEAFIYDIMITFLASKQNQYEINRSWGVTYALLQLAPIWVERLCETLKMRCPQTTASSLASVLADAGKPELVLPTLVEALDYYQYKKRFVDSIGAYADPRTVPSLLNLLEKYMHTREDDELIENIVNALQKIGDVTAQTLLTELEVNETFPITARRVARQTLSEITHEYRYFEPIPYTDEELIQGLRLRDARDPKRYSDWKMVKQTAQIILSEAQLGRNISPAVEAALIKALEHQHEDAQHSVVQALVMVSNLEAAVHAFEMKLLNSSTPDGTRKLIVESLSKVATQPGAFHLKEKICEMLVNTTNNDWNPQVKREAAKHSKALNCPQNMSLFD